MGSPPDIIPENSFQSIGFTLAARTAMRICPGPGCGSGASAHSRTSGPPYALNCNARIQPSFRMSGQPLRLRSAQPQPGGIADQDKRGQPDRIPVKPYGRTLALGCAADGQQG